MRLGSTGEAVQTANLPLFATYSRSQPRLAFWTPAMPPLYPLFNPLPFLPPAISSPTLPLVFLPAQPSPLR